MKMIDSPCLLFTRIDEVRLSQTSVNQPERDEVLLETLYSCVSPGTELRILAGRQDRLGAENFPVIPGYAQVGRVVIPDQTGLLKEGQLVFSTGTMHAAHTLAWGGHVGRAVTSASSAIPIPDTVDAVDASLLKLAAIAHRGLRLTRPAPGTRVAVVGLGPIGQLSARLFAAAGADVIAADVSLHRVGVAGAYGLTAVHVTECLNKVVRQRWPQGADIVVDATGRAAALRETMELVRDRPWEEIAAPGGTLVVQGSYSGDVPFPQDIAFLKEAEILWPRDCQRADLLAILGMLESDRLRVHDLVGPARPIATAPEVYAALQKPNCTILTAAFDWISA